MPLNNKTLGTNVISGEIETISKHLHSDIHKKNIFIKCFIQAQGKLKLSKT